MLGAPHKDNTTLLIVAAVVGVVAIGAVVAFSNSSSSSTVADPNATAAVNGIVASQENAVNQGAALKLAELSDGTTLEGSIISANSTENSNAQQSALTQNLAEIQSADDANTNATTLEETAIQAQAATAQTQIAGDASVATAAQEAGAVATEAASATTVGVATANAAKTVGSENETGNIFSSIAGAFGKIFG